MFMCLFLSWERETYHSKTAGLNGSSECLLGASSHRPKSPPDGPRMLAASALLLWRIFLGAEKNNKPKTHKYFSDGPCGTIVPRTNPHPSQGQMGQNRDFTVEFNRKRPVCPRDVSQFVPGTGPILSQDGSCLSRTPSRPKCLCLFVFCLPDISEFHFARLS